MRLFKKILIILIILVFVVVAGFCFYYGFILNNASKPINVYSGVINRIDEVVFKFFDVNDKYFIGEDFSVVGDIEFNTEGTYYLTNSVNKPDDIKIYNKLVNLNNSKITYKYIQSDKDDKVYSEYNHLIGTEQALLKKKYIENSTEYVYINSLFDKYVNNGNNVYFENITSSNTTIDNLEYLHSFIKNTIISNLKEEYFEKEKQTIKIGEEDKEVYQMSIRIDNERYIEILSNIVKDIRKDKKANDIMCSINSEFNNYKVNSEERYLEKDETYTINIYTDKIWFKPVKYEVLHLKENLRDLYYYVGDLKGTLTYINNNEVKYNTKVEIGKKLCVFNFSNKSGRNIGIIKFDKNDEMFNLDVDLLLDGKSYVVGYSSKIKDFVQDKGFTINNSINVRYSEDNIVKFSGNVKNKIIINNESTIEEEIGDVIIRTTLTEEEENKYKNYMDNLNLRLER